MEVDKEKTHEKFTFTDKNIAIILTLISLATFLYDVILSDVRDCLEMVDDRQRQIVIILITLFHHFLAVFGLFGWLFNNKIFLITYIVLIVFMIVQWKFTGGVCVVTKSVSILADNPEYKRFNDVYKIIGLKRLIPSRMLYYGSLSIFVGIALYKIIFK